MVNAKLLSAKSIFLDTAPIIYYIEENPKYLEILEEIFTPKKQNRFIFFSTVLTLIEVLVLPLKLKQFELANRYETIFKNSDYLNILPINNNIARLAAEIRAETGYKTPDSIQLAAAVDSSTEVFLTNDLRIKSDRIKIITLEEMI